MGLSLVSWRFTVLTTLGLGALVACGGNTNADSEGTGGSLAGDGGSTGGASQPTGGTAHGGASQTTGGAVAVTCVNPKDYQVPDYAHDAAPGNPTGFVECDGGWLHRPAAGTCQSYLPRDTTIKGFAPGECTSDSDCTDAPNGYCTLSSEGFNPSETTVCAYGCTKDSECGVDGMCVCAYPVGRCIVSDCLTDADCSSGLCVGVRTETSACGESTYEFACHSPYDACPASASCRSAEACQSTAEGRQCVSVGVCGRPFLVEGTARLAPLVEGTSWSAQKSPRTNGLSANERELLGQHYTRIGLMEHASVAAFARFSLELLALGAPAELLRDTQQALGDEIRHAEICFGLAAAYSGRQQRPGPLAMDGALTTPELRSVFETAFLEACIGETLAAIEVEAALSQARDPEVVAALRGIAADERRHAELGWRFIRWALEAASPEERAELTAGMLASVHAALEAEQSYAAEEGELADALVAHGLLPERYRSEARRDALEQVCLPCVQALVCALNREVRVAA